MNNSLKRRNSLYMCHNNRRYNYLDNREDNRLGNCNYNFLGNPQGRMLYTQKYTFHYIQSRNHLGIRQYNPPDNHFCNLLNNRCHNHQHMSFCIHRYMY